MKRSYLFLILLFLPLFAGADAMAPVFNILNPDAVKNGTDLSVAYLGDIFGVVDGQLHGGGSQIMGQMFGIFNSGALILAGIVAIYTTLIGTMKTAHEGEMLGRKWDSLWVPIRTILGIALLIPKATGYCIIQIFVMWVILQGVGLADTVWNQAINYLTAGGVIVQQAIQPGIGQGSVTDASQKIFLSEVCLYGLQSSLNQAYQQQLAKGISKNPPPNFLATVFPMKPDCNKKGACTLQIPGALPSTGAVGSSPIDWSGTQGACGTISWGLPSNGNSDQTNFTAAAEQAQQVAVQQILLDMSGPAQIYITNQWMTNTTAPPLTDYLEQKMFLDAAEDFKGIVYPLAKSQSTINMNAAANAELQHARSVGWILAGSWYWALSSMNNNASVGAEYTGLVPKNHLDFTDQSQPFHKLEGAVIQYSNVNNIFVSGIKYALQSSNISPSDNTQCPGSDPVCRNLKQFMQQANWFQQQNNSTYQGYMPVSASFTTFTSSMSGLLLFLLGPIGSLIGIMAQLVLLGTAQGTNSNPILMLATIGDQLISLVVETWLGGAVAIGVATTAGAVWWGFNFSNIINTMLMWIIPLLWAIFGTLFVEGGVLAYYLPLIPYIIFTFGAIGWLMLTIEAMVAAPIIALGITHPEGVEIVGKTDPAVALMLDVFLRPSMMIIGFICAIIVSYVALWLFNNGFWLSWGFMTLDVFNPAEAPIAFVMSLVMVLVIYIVLAIIIMHYSFSLINEVPDRVMSIFGRQRGVGGDVARMQGQAEQGFRTGGQAVSSGVGKTAEAASSRGKDDKGSMTTGGPGGGGDTKGGGPIQTGRDAAGSVSGG